ncbi:tetratricopeptide repeat protein [Leptolyngbya sp. AN03gr2]|uniref:tetratricopeptide repeat protein n=1 Tax=unclassified Leptolyngbya TaxID=2650499 RepID=UPI003D310755
MQDKTQTAESLPLIFICYARKDNQDPEFKQRWLDRLRSHLKPLERQKKAIVWCDERIDLGNEWDQDIRCALQSARVAIALMSPAFFASDYICEKEIPTILQQVDDQKTTFIPMLLSPFEKGAAEFQYGDSEIGEKVRSLLDFQASNGMERSLLGLSLYEQDQVLANVAERVREIVTGKKFQGSSGGEPGKETPNNLPLPSAETFVGRDDALVEIDDRLSVGQPLAICAVSGMGGIGKTELALQYAMRSRQLRDDLGAICWVNARENAGLQIVSFARSVLNLVPPELPDLVSLVGWCWRQFPSGTSLIVFDDVQEYAEVEAFLPPVGERFKVLVTTREKLDRDSVQVLKIETLKPEAAYELLFETVKDERRFRDQRSVVDELCQWVGCLPLGIKLVAKFLKIEPDLSIAELLQELKDEKLKHDGLSKIETVFELSWEKLNTAEQQLAMLLGTFGKAAIAWEWMEEAIGFCRVEADSEPVEQWCQLLEAKALRRGRRRLAELSLLERSGENQYQVHPLLQEFFAAKRVGQADRAIKTAVAQVIIGIAKQIPQTPTLEIIGAVAGAIPHLQAVAEDLMQVKHRNECGIADDTDLIWVFIRISRFYQGQGLYADAEPWLADCLAVARSLLGETHPHVATSLNNLAALYESQGRYEEAEPLYQQALELDRLLLGETHPHVATSLDNLALLYRVQGRYKEAEPLHQQALELRRLLLGETHPHVATSLNNLALLYRVQGRYKEAEPLYQQALELRRSLLGETHPHVAMSLNNLALLYCSQGRYEEAEPLYQQALKLCRSLLGETHPDVATSLNNLAALYESQGRYEEAEPLYQQALELCRSLLGETHPDVATSLNNLAELYRVQGRYEEAEPLYQQALELCRSLLGETHPDVATSLNNLALLYVSQGRYEEAESLYQRALELRRSLLGEQHPNTEIGLWNLAVLYAKQERFAQAEPLLIQAVTVLQQRLGNQHPTTVKAQSWLDSVQQSRGEVRDSE